MTTDPSAYLGSPRVTLAQVRAWVGISPTQVTDEQLATVLGAETVLQAQACTVPPEPLPLPDNLIQALYRRVARVLAARQVPLGLVGDPASEAGQARLATFDAEVERLEGGCRRVVFG